jgi:hypothetical protein
LKLVLTIIVSNKRQSQSNNSQRCGTCKATQIQNWLALIQNKLLLKEIVFLQVAHKKVQEPEKNPSFSK